MKLVRFGEPGRERPGLIDPAGRLRDLSGHVCDIGGKTLLPDYLTAIRRASPATLPLVEGDVRLGPCVAAVGKIVGIGLNYPDFFNAADVPAIERPLLFLKAPSAISGPYDDVVLPAGSTRTDWELELAVVVGKPGTGIAEQDALDHIAGYCIVNDYSERNYVLNSESNKSWLLTDWTRGKNYDTFAPLGPWLVTPDEIPDPQALELRVEIDGQLKQLGHTADMIHGVTELVSAISRCMSLHTGDVIMTGSPAGTGISLSPEVFLRPGQTVRTEITGLGEQCQTVRALHSRESETYSVSEPRQQEYDWQAIYSPSP